MQRFDKYSIGIVLGLILPALVCYLYIDQFNLWSSIRMFGAALAPTWCKLLMVSVFPNLALVFVFYSIETWRLSKGVLIGAFPYLLAAIWFTI